MVDGRNHPKLDRAPDPLGSLRRAVDDLHQAVDERSFLGAPGLDESRYGAAVSALARVLPAVEDAVIRSPHGGEYDEPIAHLLLRDAEELGLAVGTPDQDPPELGTAGAWWGAAYVLHGSRLGATFIDERLAVDLPALPRTYFAAAASGARPAWARFRAAARPELARGTQLDDAIVAARAVFESLLVEFERVAVATTQRGVA